VILILGASSYIGRHTFESLGGSMAIGTYRSNKVPGGLYFDATKMSLSEVLPLDVDISHAVIIYAEPGIDACKADIDRSYDINVRSTKQVIDDLIQRGIKPIFTSSEYVFDGQRGHYTEADSPNPTTVYGSQKVEIERYLSEHCDDYAVLRLAKVFGTDPKDGTILSNWLKQIRNGEEIRCARDQIFSPIHVDDVVAVAGSVIHRGLRGVYNVSNTQPWSRLGMLRELLDRLGAQANVVECNIRDFDFLDDRPLDLSMEPDKVLQATGLKFREVRSCCDELLSRASS